jgi:16S rRNA (guanine(966)-N(2))-methyltransferase RsmD
MYIISGTLKGRRIAFNNRKQGNARVTSDFVKKAVFSSLGETLSNLHFLDLFGCSGQMGLEAFSRGAHVLINECDHRRHRFIADLIATWSLCDKIDLYNRPAEKLLPQLATEKRAFHIVYLDPPYHESFDDLPMAHAFLQRLSQTPILAPNARIVVQHDLKVILPESHHTLFCIRKKKYGDSMVSTFEHRAFSS